MAARHASPAISRSRRLAAQDSRYPLDAQDRAVVRREIRERVMAEAHRQAATLGRSMKCGGWGGIAPPRHAGAEYDGCANDGTGCVCECHDPTTQPVEST